MKTIPADSELELKYLVYPSLDRQRVKKHILRSLSRDGFNVDRKERRSIQDTYLDTPRGDVERAGYTLRRRATSAGIEFTVKSITSGIGLLQRTELNQSSPSNKVPSTGPVPSFLQGLEIDTEKLCPQTITQTERWACRLQHPIDDAVLELAIDQVDTDSGLSYQEYEFELIQGPPEVMARLTTVLSNQREIYPARLSKYQRARYALDPSIGRSSSAAPKPASPIGDVNATLSTLRYLQPFAWEAIHPEGVHQARVATRRLQAKLELHADDLPEGRAQSLTEAAQDLARALGRVRDLDVHIAQILAENGETDLLSYRSHLERQRRKAHLALRSLPQMKDTECFSDIQETNQQDERNALGGTAFPRVLERNLRTALKLGRGLLDSSDATALHELRMLMKQIRYQLETLAAVDGIEPLIDSVRRIQHVLGEHQDARMARDKTKRFTSRNPDYKKSLTEFRRSQKKAMRRQRKAFINLWQDFDERALAFQTTRKSAG